MADATPPIPTETAAEKAGPSNLQLRITWGVLGAALLLGSVRFSPITFGLFFAAVQAVMLWEFYRMMRAGGYAPATWLGVGLSVAIFTGVLYYSGVYNFMQGHNQAGYVRQGDVTYPLGIAANDFILTSILIEKAAACLLGLLPVILLIRGMLLWPERQQPFADAAATLMGLLYVAVPMSMLNLIIFKYENYDPRRIFALLFLIWASDIGAYAVGRAIGKHKLAPKISPGKTWEGWAGGFVLTLIVGWAIGLMLPDMPLAHRLVAAGVVAVFAPLGDLAESMLKRSVGVKDSGSIMPGHGGLLDRFDAFLLVLPVLALLQLLAG